MSVKRASQALHSHACGALCRPTIPRVVDAAIAFDASHRGSSNATVHAAIGSRAVLALSPRARGVHSIMVPARVCLRAAEECRGRVSFSQPCETVKEVGQRPEYMRDYVVRPASFAHLPRLLAIITARLISRMSLKRFRGQLSPKRTGRFACARSTRGSCRACRGRFDARRVAAGCLLASGWRRAAPSGTPARSSWAASFRCWRPAPLTARLGASASSLLGLARQLIEALALAWRWSGGPAAARLLFQRRIDTFFAGHGPWTLCHDRYRSDAPSSVPPLLGW